VAQIVTDVRQSGLLPEGLRLGIHGDSNTDTAVANALAWERQREIPRALVEYPAVGAVREVELTCRRTAAYRRVLRTVRSMDGPPPRVDDSRCESCEYRTECGVKTRSLRSLLGL
jgi:CRISPR-associated exonuclease Cas4